jgi:hypothetical protein
MLIYDTSTESSSNPAPIDQISKNRDGGSSGGSFPSKKMIT